MLCIHYWLWNRLLWSFWVKYYLHKHLSFCIFTKNTIYTDRNRKEKIQHIFVWKVLPKPTRSMLTPLNVQGQVSVILYSNLTKRKQKPQIMMILLQVFNINFTSSIISRTAQPGQEDSQFIELILGTLICQCISLLTVQSIFYLFKLCFIPFSQWGGMMKIF